MREKMSAKFSNAFLFLAVGFFMLFSPLIGKAQSNSTSDCEWKWVLGGEFDFDYDYNPATGRYENFYAYRFKSRHKCVPIAKETNSTNSSNNSSQQFKSQEVWELREEANRLVEQKKYTKAIDKYTLAIELDSDDALSYQGRADAKLELKNYREAIADYDQAIRLFSDWLVKENARTANGGTGHVTRESFFLVLNYPRFYHGRGVARQLLGDKIGASEDFRKACSLGFDEDC